MIKKGFYDQKAETFVTIQESFVQFLIDYKYKDLVAFYLSHVPSEIQVKLYSKFLQSNFNYFIHVSKILIYLFII
jgi:hypothetical protein